MEGFGVERLVVLARYRSLVLENGSTLFAVQLTVGTHGCRAIGVGLIGIGSLAVQALGALLVVKVVGNGVQAGVVGRSGGSGFIGQGGVGSAMGGVRWFGPTGRDQTYVPQGEPTLRRGGGAQGRGRNVGVPGAGVGGPRIEEGVQGGGVGAAGLQGVEEPLPPGRVLSQRRQALDTLEVLVLSLFPMFGVWWRVYSLRNLPLQYPPRPLMLKWWPAFTNFMILRRKGRRRWRRLRDGWRRLGLRFYRLRKGWLRWMGNCKEFMTKLKLF